MTAITEHPNCPRCGSPVPPEAPGGECPKCLLGAVAAPAEPSMPRPAVGEWPALDEVRAAFPDLDIEGEIGRGGMAIVFKARQLHLDRLVALKILAPWLAAEPGFAERFSREARVLARLNHPNIVTIHDFGQASQFFYLLMEYVDGVNLRQAMQAGRFAPAQALGLVPRICDALQYAHGEGVLHRDIKPDNILLDSRGRVKIADFGIAKLAGEQELPFTLTQSGMRLGTPAYMAPEQVEKPGDVDHRADIYSLGVVLYEMLTGELPLGRFAAPSEKSAVDARIDEIVFRTLEKERERRYQTAEEVKTRVEGLGGPPPPPPPVGAVVSPGPAWSGGPAALAEAPLCKKALWGAVGTGLSVCGMLVLLPTWTVTLAPGSHGPIDSGPEGAPAGFLILGLIVLLGGIAVSAVAGMVLGWAALADIRRSGGHRRGAGLGVFAALAWPLLILTGVGAGLSAMMSQSVFDEVFRPAGREWLKTMLFLAGVGVVLWLDVTIIRRVLRWAQGGRGEGEGAPIPTAATVAAPPTGIATVPRATSGMALASGILALVSLMPVVLLGGLMLMGLVMSGSRGGAAIGLGQEEIAIIFFISGVPALVGMILGLVAMRRIRDSGGRLGGAGWAVLGGMSWFAMVLFAIGLGLGSMVARAMPGALGGMISAGLALGAPALLSGRLFRFAWSWTQGGDGMRAPRRRDWVAVGIGVLALLMAGALAGGRSRRDAHSVAGARAAVIGDFDVDGSRARVAVNEVKETTEWTSERPIQVQRLDLNVEATLAVNSRLVCEVRRVRAGGQEANVRRLEEATLLTGSMLEGGQVTMHRAFTIELPEGAGGEALQDAHRQLNQGWLHRERAVLLARPEPLFRVLLPDGTAFEAVFILLPADQPI